MSILTTYKNQVELLLDVLPFIQDDSRFALKGGTAINLFHRDMPRLSVDIDLTYLPVKSREDSLAEIDTALKAIAHTAGSGLPAEEIIVGDANKEGAVTKLFARGNGVQI